jgi:hypothetical protein
MTVAAIHQPNYLPWLGYFHKMKAADVFVFLDTVDYQSGNAFSITNRARIKGGNSVVLLTVPISGKTASRRIHDVCVDFSTPWARKHLRSIEMSYRRARYFSPMFEVLEAVLSSPPVFLAELNSRLILEVSRYLKVSTPIVYASALGVGAVDRNQRLIEVCERVGATTYLSGQGGQKYNDEALFLQHGIRLTYTRFTSPEYPQLHGEFVPGLSVIDAIFNCGPGATGLL